MTKRTEDKQPTVGDPASKVSARARRPGLNEQGSATVAERPSNSEIQAQSVEHLAKIYAKLKASASAEEAETANGGQSDRFIAKARELGLDEREETFDAALKKVARHKASDKAVEPADD